MARPRSGRRMHCPGSSRTGSRRQVGLPGVANSRQRPHGGGNGDGAGPGLRPNAELLASGTSGPTPPACHAGPGLLVGQLLTPGVTLSVLGDCVARGCVQRPNCEDRARHRWAERPGRCVFHSGSTLGSSRACPAGSRRAEPRPWVARPLAHTVLGEQTWVCRHGTAPAVSCALQGSRAARPPAAPVVTEQCRSAPGLCLREPSGARSEGSVQWDAWGRSCRSLRAMLWSLRDAALFPQSSVPAREPGPGAAGRGPCIYNHDESAPLPPVPQHPSRGASDALWP